MSSTADPVEVPEASPPTTPATGNGAAATAVAPAVAPAATNPIAALDHACIDVVRYRQRPLLVLYYPDHAGMTEDDLEDVYTAFREAGLSVENKLPSLDVLIESNGGNPVAGYRLAQLIRDFAADVSFLVADHAYSAATLLCFAGNVIRLAHFAGLSPIDITLVTPQGDFPGEEVELANIDNFLEFAKKARRTIEELLQLGFSDSRTNVDSDLLVAMVNQVSALQVGKYFRERMLTAHYAEELLDTYMFPKFADAKERRDDIVRNFLFGAPSHQFHIDYHLCTRWRLPVEEMPTAESVLVKKAVEKMNDLAGSGMICARLSRYQQMPFFQFYANTQASAAPGDAHAQSK